MSLKRRASIIKIMAELIVFYEKPGIERILQELIVLEMGEEGFAAKKNECIQQLKALSTGSSDSAERRGKIDEFLNTVFFLNLPSFQMLPLNQQKIQTLRTRLNEIFSNPANDLVGIDEPRLGVNNPCLSEAAYRSALFLAELNPITGNDEILSENEIFFSTGHRLDMQVLIKNQLALPEALVVKQQLNDIWLAPIEGVELNRYDLAHLEKKLKEKANFQVKVLLSSSEAYEKTRVMINEVCTLVAAEKGSLFTTEALFQRCMNILEQISKQDAAAFFLRIRIYLGTFVQAVKPYFPKNIEIQNSWWHEKIDYSNGLLLLHTFMTSMEKDSELDQADIKGFIDVGKRQYIWAVANSPYLSDAQREVLLRPELYKDLENRIEQQGELEDVTQFLHWMLYSAFPNEQKQAYVEAKNSAGETFLRRALFNNDIEAVAEYVNQILQSPLPSALKKVIIDPPNEDGLSLIHPNYPGIMNEIAHAQILSAKEVSWHLVYWIAIASRDEKMSPDDACASLINKMIDKALGFKGGLDRLGLSNAYLQIILHQRIQDKTSKLAQNIQLIFKNIANIKTYNEARKIFNAIRELKLGSEPLNREDNDTYTQVWH